MNISFDINSNFWKQDPEIDLLFKDERESKYTDTLMWSIFLYVHPRSKFFNLDDKTKIDLISKDYLQKEFIPTNYEKTIHKVKKLVLSPIERTFVVWNDKFKEREEFLATTTYSANTYQMLDKMMADTFQMKKQYDAIVKEFQQEKDDKTFGDVEESLSEKGII